MEFRILGPLEVVSDDGPVEVPGVKPRTLLALLLVHANRVVSQDRLAGELWEGTPPAAATTTLQTYVYQLRRALRTDCLRTRPGGYVLEVRDSAVDALRFERTVSEVSHVEKASPRWVAVRLGEALSWWRGPPLADFEGAPWAKPEIARLVELRLGAIEARVDARLALGEHAVLVPELTALVREHPLRERLWWQLILALYRCDRQADALRTYQRVRRLLGEQLGLQPGLELVELERRILDHDESLLRPPAETVNAEPTPAGAAIRAAADEPGVGLPSPPTSFIGRQAEVEEVRRLLDRHRLVTVTGAGGCGKTRLAVEVASRLAGRFADGARFADLAAVDDPARVATAVATALGLAPDTTGADLVDRLARYLGERDVLCVLDNCEQVLDACARLAEAVLAHDGSSRLLATSREPLGVQGEQVYVAPTLDVATDAVHLFAERAGEARAGFVLDDANRETIMDICRRLDGIPLAIELAAARMVHLSPAQALERLDDRFDILIGRRRAPRHQTLKATFDWSYELLEPQEQDALRCLSVFPASFTLEAAEAVVGHDDAVTTLGALVAKSLVQTVDEGDRLRYRMPETVRVYARGRLAAAGETERCRDRHRDWVLRWLESVPLEERLLSDVDHFSAEHANIHAALEWSAARGDSEALARIAAGTDWRRGEYRHDGRRWCEAAAAAAGALPAQVRVLLYLTLFGLAALDAMDVDDWVRIAEWAERAIAAADPAPSPLHACALGLRAWPAAIEAVAGEDERLARRATELAETNARMGDTFTGPWRMFCRLAAGVTHSILRFGWPHHGELAQRHYAAGAAVTRPTPPYLGLHAQITTQLALHRFLTGDVAGAGALARQAHGHVALSRYIQREAPLTLALIITLDPAGDPGALDAELRAYHDAARRRDWGTTAMETVLLYRAFDEAARERWELACQLLAAGERAAFGSPPTAALYVHYNQRVLAALDTERFERLYGDGRTLPLSDALAEALR